MDTGISTRQGYGAQAGGNGLMLVADNADALAMRVLAARGATETLDLMYYIWRDDRCGSLLAQEVVAAADRGVRVRMLIDDINPQTSDQHYLTLDSHPNISVRLFNPSGMRNGSLFRWLEMVLRLFAMTRRMHAKAWVADRRYAIVGGRNIGNEYFGAASTNFRDLDLLMIGPAVDETAAIFERFWNHPVSRSVADLNPGMVAGDLDPIRSARFDAGELTGGAETLDAFMAARPPLFRCERVRVLSDPPEKAVGRRNRNWLMRELTPEIDSASQRLELVSPYFIPGRKGTAMLKRLVARGVRVIVLTNSLATTDVAAVHGAYSNYRKKLLRAGVELYEFQPSGERQKISVFGSKGASLHTKAFIVDDRLGFIGSMNFDPRSVSLNAEMGVLFEDRDLVARLGEHFADERDPDTSYRLSLKRMKLHWNRTEGDEIVCTGREPKATNARRLLAWAVRWLPIESQL